MLPKHEALRHYVEELTLIIEQLGAPRTASRVLAYLLISDPPHQTMNNLMEGLQMSKSSVSSATITLIQYRLVERVSLPGERRDYYRVQNGVWNKMMYTRFEAMGQFREMAEKGLRLLEGSPETQTDRLNEMYHFFTFLEKEMPKLLERWEAEKSQTE